MPNALARYATDPHEGMTHEPFTPPDNPVGNAITRWAQGVKDRSTMQGYANALTEQMKAPPDELAMNWVSPLGGMVGATAYHGSPHLFDKFDLAKIGTGEGAQVYGHGTYLAENPSVAQQYMKGGQEADALYKQLGALRMAKQPVPEELYTAIQKAENDVPGALYKTDIPDTHIDKMLDWDKPLSEQHPDVQNIIRPQLTQDVIDGVRARGQGGLAKRLGNDPSGSAIYSAITGHDNPSSKLASQALYEAGIPGIKYMDALSREAGEGTRNFVMFNPSEDVRILERNGMPTGNVPFAAEQPKSSYQQMVDDARAKIAAIMPKTE